MDSLLTEQQVMFKQQMREFAAKEIEPVSYTHLTLPTSDLV